MEKQCGYCRKPIESGNEVKSTLIYRNGSQLRRKEKEYCSNKCASQDQIAHEG
ncbi:hypothetical protein CIW61_06370 [Enterobacter cloacae]|uniref:YdaE family protein n=1 Tax=Enterobacter sp. TaxID=42895 RepID=UPI000BA83B1D|nr:YdaE family protein [Enterobacter sp.]PAO07144.1 hypothetical protein CIW61_06370 [Enterobacter cloacae]